jgi:signal transduction histidine kinase
MARLRLSLASKCQLMFGAAVVLILTAALSVPWLRMQKLVDEGQREIARGLAETWLSELLPFSGIYTTELPATGGDSAVRRVHLIAHDELDREASADPLLNEALRQLESGPGRLDVIQTRHGAIGGRIYHYTRAIRSSDLERARRGLGGSGLTAMQPADPMRGVLVIEMRATWANKQLLLNRIYIVTAGLLAGALAIAVFWYITTRVILSPVRVLRETADKVASGDLNIRSDIDTGDEFEHLADAFNTMLTTLKHSQDQLRALNRQLDLKLGELAETNVSLFEANRLKTDFLANVSHELRTPLNSIIGFAELLSESLGMTEDAIDEKARRYADNILKSSRSLMALINDLLDLAKIEAGRVELTVEPLVIADACEGLANLIRPQADRRSITVDLEIEPNLPIIRTDPGKWQQVIFNFLSNAVKFTPEGGRIELGAASRGEDDQGRPTAVSVWVSDTGPGIPIEAHETIFEKFRQVDASHTKEHSGTGLGLAISRELARLLDARIELDSDVGRGATFSLVCPLAIEPKSESLMPDLTGGG